MKLYIALIIVTLNGGIVQDIDARRLSRAQRTRTGSHGLCGGYGSLLYEFWCDVLIGSFGTRPLSPENEAFVRMQLKTFGLPQADSIRIRRLSQVAIYSGCGPKNAMVVFLGNFWPTYMFVAEEWFDTLSVEQKTFLIAHETMHLILCHAQKRMLLSQIGTSVIVSLVIGLGQAMKASALLAGHPWLATAISIGIPVAGVWTMGALLAAQSRQHEYEADEHALYATKSLQGGINLLQDLELLVQKIEEDLPQWSLLLWQRKTLQSWFGTHPTCPERIGRLCDIARRTEFEMDSAHQILPENVDNLISEIYNN